MVIIYLIENKINNKIYIGLTKNTLEKRWKQHFNKALKNDCNTPFYNAIRKYGIDCWNMKVVFECENTEIAKQKEIEYISLYDSYNNGYNATFGGDGNNGILMSKESNLKRSFALKGKPKNYNRMHNKKHSQSTIDKMKKPKKDKINYNTEKFKQIMREKQAKFAFERRALTFEQYQQIQSFCQEGISKKHISQLLNISYDLVKKWSCREW